MPYMACASHQEDTLARGEDTEGFMTRDVRIGHECGALWQCLAGGEPSSPVAVEAVGDW